MPCTWNFGIWNRGRPNVELSQDITADYGPDGKLAGLEILDASQLFGDHVGKVVLELAQCLLRLLTEAECSIPAGVGSGTGSFIISSWIHWRR